VGGVNVSDIYPQVAVVALDVKETKPVSVKVETRGVPNEEFEAQAPVPDITVVEVTGPRTQVETVVGVFGTVDISGAAGTIANRLVPLTAVDAQNNTVPNVELNPEPRFGVSSYEESSSGQDGAGKGRDPGRPENGLPGQGSTR
jgi:YbbR domain-containing protein